MPSERKELPNADYVRMVELCKPSVKEVQNFIDNPTINTLDKYTVGLDDEMKRVVISYMVDRAVAYLKERTKLLRSAELSVLKAMKETAKPELEVNESGVIE